MVMKLPLMLSASLLALCAACSSAKAGVTDFTYTGGFQSFTAPSTGLYDILAYGAQGGSSSRSAGGNGAEIGGNLMLTANEVLQIAVGGMGANNHGAGGGGGSFVVGPNSTPLVIAGGGGGASGAKPGGEGLITRSGAAGTHSGGAGGTNGSGGHGGYGYSGGNGGGFKGSGNGGFGGNGFGYPLLMGGYGYTRGGLAVVVAAAVAVTAAAAAAAGMAALAPVAGVVRFSLDQRSTTCCSPA
jgi:hypothetical protein